MPGNTLSNQPPRGTSDWFGDEIKIRRYIFNAWRDVCLDFGFEEYLTPLFEDKKIYEAKSGDEVGNKELTTFIDKSGKEFAIRPEMTPSVTRLVSRIYESRIKPIKLFSIANFVRNQRPQKGRNREFWQLNFDIFGSTKIESDIEVIAMAIEIMLKFDPPKNSFKIHINHRVLIDFFLDNIIQVNGDVKLKLVRLMDKWSKFEQNEFQKELRNLQISDKKIQLLINFLVSEDEIDLKGRVPGIEECKAFLEIKSVLEILKKLGYKDWITFNSSIVRGFDYYDGLVFEVFDNDLNFNRSLFGGGRYNGLALIFGKNSFPAVGFAPGDESLRMFLNNWNLVNKILDKVKEELYYFPLLEDDLYFKNFDLANKLRKNESLKIEIGFKKQTVTKALEYANKKGINKIIIFGIKEEERDVFLIKDLETGEQREFILNENMS